MPSLTFKNGQFEFAPTLLQEPPLVYSEYWNLKPGTSSNYVTTNIQAAARFRAYADERAEKVFERAFVKTYALPTSPLPTFLDAHQVEGVNWILSRSRSYLAHAPGAGKTCEAIVAAYSPTLRTGQTLFIVPPSLTKNWEREIEKFLGLMGHSLNDWKGDTCWSALPPTAYKGAMNWEAKFLIVPDSMLTKNWVLKELAEFNFSMIVVDEASRFKEATAERSIALFGGTLKDGRKCPGLIYNAKHAVLMDGSPMPNRAMELWAPTFAMSPESIDFMDQNSFGFRYCAPRQNHYNGAWEFRGTSNHEDLRRRLQNDFMHVVPEANLNHPERRRSMLFMTKDPRTVAMKSWEQKNLSVLPVSESDSQGELAKYRRELGLRKVKWAADYVADRLKEKGESILLFAWHRDVVFALAIALKKYLPGIVLGGTSPVLRERMFERFQSGKNRLLIMNIAAGGRGHNLQRADRVVFAEYSWTDENNIQCEKRASRKGSDKAFVRADYIVAPGTLDERILSAVFTKSRNVRRVIG